MLRKTSQIGETGLKGRCYLEATQMGKSRGITKDHIYERSQCHNLP